ncbi:hypothetical protein CYY_004804 [Polysphondylium violaceum]|uniref:DH domain-containing protein n=1 Tax=Polysphondylium violaceum TaxID=133409 RepID=A0A8J4PVA6_9MYCE|nr:hypothetical protein CYY_004804 [Polysphondylium violaceum]
MMKEDEISINSGISGNNSAYGGTNNTSDDISDTCSIFEEDLLSHSDSFSSCDEAISKRERLRQQTVIELVKTETSYVRDLKLIVKLYIKPVRSKITIRDYHDVFGSTERLLDIHRDYLSELEGIHLKPPRQQNVGEVLFKLFNHNDYMNLYGYTCTQQNTCNESFERLKSTCKLFSQCIEEANKSQLLRGLSFPMLIIKPIQRITKYPLLLKSLVEYTPSDYPDYQFLSQSLYRINSILDYVNHQKRLADDKIDNEKKLKEIELNLSIDYLVSQSRRFIKEGLASKKIDKGLLKCILLNDILILAKNKKSTSSKKVLFLENVLVRDYIEALPGVTTGLELLLINDKKEKLISLYFNNELEKKEWFALLYPMTNGVQDPNKIAKYKWFTKKTTIPMTMSVDISMSPSPSQSPLNASRDGSPNGQITPTLPSNIKGAIGGSMKETRKPPPPPRSQDLFKNNSANSSTNSSPSNTLTQSAINSLSVSGYHTSCNGNGKQQLMPPSTTGVAQNFSRASSVPSFMNVLNEEMRPNPKRMPPTIACIPIGCHEENAEVAQHTATLKTKPALPPRNHSPSPNSMQHLTPPPQSPRSSPRSPPRSPRSLSLYGSMLSLPLPPPPLQIPKSPSFLPPLPPPPTNHFLPMDPKHLPPPDPSMIPRFESININANNSCLPKPTPIKSTPSHPPLFSTPSTLSQSQNNLFSHPHPPPQHHHPLSNSLSQTNLYNTHNPTFRSNSLNKSQSNDNLSLPLPPPPLVLKKIPTSANNQPLPKSPSNDNLGLPPPPPNANRIIHPNSIHNKSPHNSNEHLLLPPPPPELLNNISPRKSPLYQSESALPPPPALCTPVLPKPNFVKQTSFSASNKKINASAVTSSPIGNGRVPGKQ